jgi:transposase-like protein
MRTRRPRPAPIARSAFAGFRFPPDITVLAVRWYLRFGLSYRDVEDLLAEHGVEVDHVAIYRWVQRFAPLLAEAARPYRHAVRTRGHADETYVKVAGQWRYVYRAVDQFGQVVEVFVSPRREARAARRFFQRAIGTTRITLVEVVTDHAPVYPGVLEELAPAAWHRADQYANKPGRVRSRPTEGTPLADAGPQARPQRQDRDHRACLHSERSAGHYELAIEEPASRWVAVTFDELALAI